MGSWIQQVLSSDHFGLAALPAAFLLGFLGAVSSCCTAPVLAAVAGYGGAMGDRPARRELWVLGLFFMIGTIASLAILGAVASFVGHAASASLGRYWHFAGGLVMVAFGLFTLGLFPLEIPTGRLTFWLPGRGTSGAVVYGLAVGGASSACTLGCNPLLPVAIGAAALKGASLLGAAMLALFALGYSLPLTAALIGIGAGAGRLTGSARRALPAMKVIFGLVLIATGFYLLAKP